MVRAYFDVLISPGSFWKMYYLGMTTTTQRKTDEPGGYAMNLEVSSYSALDMTRLFPREENLLRDVWTNIRGK